MAERDDQAYLVVLTTLATAEAARAFVRRAVEERVAACGTIVPGATSIFHWQGAVAEESEVLVLLKTHTDRWEALRRLTDEAHPYDVPELLAVPVTAGLPAYLAWLRAETATREERQA